MYYFYYMLYEHTYEREGIFSHKMCVTVRETLSRINLILFLGVFGGDCCVKKKSAVGMSYRYCLST